tara:strand:- start:2333 stop:3193 length:861 start_codon:yes stop_codon:yes gene_type:complete
MIIDIFLPASLIFIMLSLGLGLELSDFTNLVRKPRSFFVGLTNQIFLLPIVTYIVILVFGITKEAAVGMMILACCPGGVTSNIITKLAKGDTALSISYTAFNSILAIITLPLIVGFSMKSFMGLEAPDVNILSLGLTMFFITAVPVGIGLLIREKNKYYADKFEPKASKISTILFAIIILGALLSEWDTFINNFVLLGPAIVLLILAMLIIAYKSSKLFKMSDKQSITVAIESAMQNGTVGITVGNLIINPESGLSILSIPSGVYSILMYLICLPFVYWFLKRTTI